MFAYYESGIITDEVACGTSLNHEVAVVGFSNAQPTPYFIVRNSWGDDWGMGGYMYVGMSSGKGVCGI